MSEIDSQSGLDAEEREVIWLLMAAWNKFTEMSDVITTKEMEQFKHAIDAACRVFAERALHRAYPEFWR